MRHTYIEEGNMFMHFSRFPDTLACAYMTGPAQPPKCWVGQILLTLTFEPLRMLHWSAGPRLVTRHPLTRALYCENASRNHAFSICDR